MKASTIRKELHLAIDNISDESLLEAVYVLLSNRMQYDLSPAQEKELARRIADDESGKTDNIPWKKSLKSVRAKIRK